MKISIEIYSEALKVRTLEHFPMDYAMTQNNLGTAYSTLAEAEEKAENCKKAITSYEEALIVFQKVKFPEPYEVVRRNLERAQVYCFQQE